MQMFLGLAYLSKATCQLLGKPKKMLKVTLATCIGKFPSSGMTIQVNNIMLCTSKLRTDYCEPA